MWENDLPTGHVRPDLKTHKNTFWRKLQISHIFKLNFFIRKFNALSMIKNRPTFSATHGSEKRHEGTTKVSTSLHPPH